MNTLILMRHAKSGWDDPTADDFDRVLTKRGARAATALGGWLAERGHVPERALVSAARRTCQTWDGLSASLPANVKVERLEQLYLASAQTLLNTLRNQSAGSVLLLAHNPGMAELAARLVKKAPDHPGFRAYPTGATTVLEVRDWADLEWGTGTVTDFVVPRDLD